MIAQYLWKEVWCSVLSLGNIVAEESTAISLKLVAALLQSIKELKSPSGQLTTGFWLPIGFSDGPGVLENYTSPPMTNNHSSEV